MILDLIFPKYCLICYRHGEYLCATCKNYLPQMEIQECIVCGKYSIQGKTHKVCKLGFSPLFLLATYEYKGYVKEYILSAKGNKGVLQALPPLISAKPSKDILTFISEELGPNLIIPAPMTKSFLGQRLYNHAKYISDEVEKIINVPVLDILSKNSKKAQKELDRSARYNLFNNIDINKKYVTDIQGKNLLLVDDVVTTGATFITCSKLLIEHGANSIICYALSKDLLYNT